MNMTICPFCKNEVMYENLFGYAVARFNCKNCKMEFALNDNLIEVATWKLIKEKFSDSNMEFQLKKYNSFEKGIITLEIMEKIIEILNPYHASLISKIKKHEINDEIAIIGKDSLLFIKKPSQQ